MTAISLYFITFISDFSFEIFSKAKQKIMKMKEKLRGPNVHSFRISNSLGTNLLEEEKLEIEKVKRGG